MVEGDIGAAVVALDHAPVVVGIDPEIVIVAMRGGNFGEGLAAIRAAPELEVVDVDGLGVLRIGGDVGVVPGPGDQALIVADLLPLVAVVVGAVEPALGSVLDQRPDATGLSR